MQRRKFLAGVAALMAASPALAHSPYRQWAVFRQRFLLITTTRDDKASDDLGEEVARILLALLPASHAQVSRARDWKTLASLLTTHQTEVAVMARARAEALYRGEAPYQDFGPSPLRTLVQTRDYCVVCREDFPVHHAYLLSEALMQESAEQGFSLSMEGSIPAHPGVLVFARGEPLPKPPNDEKEVRRAQ